METLENRPILHFKKLPNCEFEVYSPFYPEIEGFYSDWTSAQWNGIGQLILHHLFQNRPLTLILPNWPEHQALYSDFANREARFLREILKKDVKSRRNAKVWFAFVEAPDDSFWELLLSSTEFLMDDVLITDLPREKLEEICGIFSNYLDSQSLQSMGIGNWMIPIGDGYGLNLKLNDHMATGFESIVKSVADRFEWKFSVA